MPIVGNPSGNLQCIYYYHIAKRVIMFISLDHSISAKRWCIHLKLLHTFVLIIKCLVVKHAFLGTHIDCSFNEINLLIFAFMYICKQFKNSQTLRSLSSLPANASNKVVLPDPGGPKSRVILHKTNRMSQVRSY
jgi:hypothetical protein